MPNYIESLFQPLVPNSPMIPPTTANAGTALPFTTMANPPMPAQPAAPSMNWMPIVLLGGLAFGAYYLVGGFGKGSKRDNDDDSFWDSETAAPRRKVVKRKSRKTLKTASLPRKTVKRKPAARRKTKRTSKKRITGHIL